MNSLLDLYEATSYEKNLLKTSGNKVLVNAIKNRNPVSFIYKGPNVKAGKRFKVEFVALGTSKKGNLIIRGYVQPPSVSKKGYDKTNWRTFMVSRMFDINVHNEEQFDIKRPQYKEGNDDSMNVTYVTSDWGDKEPEIKSVEPTQQPQATQKPAQQPQQKEPETDKTIPSLPQKEKPSINPPTQQNTQQTNNIFNTINQDIKTLDNQKTITKNNYDNYLANLMKSKISNWNSAQKGSNGNIMPGQGTRERFKKESDSELKDFLNKNNINIVDDETNLQESIIKIKKLML